MRAARIKLAAHLLAFLFRLRNTDRKQTPGSKEDQMNKIYMAVKKFENGAEACSYVQGSEADAARAMGYTLTEMAPVSGSVEPFGYFRALPLSGWEDCAETDEGAIALYEHPPHALAAAQAENKRMRELLERAEGLLFCARDALSKMGLRDRGSDCGFSHEVRMFALRFSQEGREGPGSLQVTGTGDLHNWIREARAALSTPADTAEYDRLVADAGRYRWLRVRGGASWTASDAVGNNPHRVIVDDYDAAIDAARAEVKS